MSQRGDGGGAASWRCPGGRGTAAPAGARRVLRWVPAGLRRVLTMALTTALPSALPRCCGTCCGTCTAC